MTQPPDSIPNPLTDPQVAQAQTAEAVAFAKAAVRVGRADPSDIDMYLALASSAFESKNYASARKIFRAFLPALGEGEIDIGVQEMLEEALTSDLTKCAGRYLVAVYMGATTAKRPEKIYDALDHVSSIEQFSQPLREIEAYAVEALPNFPIFIPSWRAFLESTAVDWNDSWWSSPIGDWMREAIVRTKGIDGMAAIARETKHASNLRAWCSELAATGNWEASLTAFNEAAELAQEKWIRNEFLDDAVLAAQQINHRDLASLQRKAWFSAPTMPRLLRWLGSSSDKSVLHSRVAEAFAFCPTGPSKMIALLHVLSQNISESAALLASAPGIGWSMQDHPGYLLFPLFANMLRNPGRERDRHANRATNSDSTLRSGDSAPADAETSRLYPSPEPPAIPKLSTPEVSAVIAIADLPPMSDPISRAKLLKAMKIAAENRIRAVATAQRRSHYAHAAELVATCLACNPTQKTADWVSAIRAIYRRRSALQTELDQALAKTPTIRVNRTDK